jgi:hypothetical protein
MIAIRDGNTIIELGCMEFQKEGRLYKVETRQEKKYKLVTGH